MRALIHLRSTLLFQPPLTLFFFASHVSGRGQCRFATLAGPAECEDIIVACLEGLKEVDQEESQHISSYYSDAWSLLTTTSTNSLKCSDPLPLIGHESVASFKRTAPLSQAWLHVWTPD